VSAGANQFDTAAPSGDRVLAGKQAALTALRWGAAAVIAALVHFVAAWTALSWREAETTPDAPPLAIMIDLAPLAVAPPAPPQDVAPGPQMTEAQPVPTPDAPAPVDDPPDPTLQTPVATPAPPKPDPAPTERQQTAEELKTDVPPPPQPQEIKVPDLPKKDDAEATLAPPPPLPSKPRAHKEPPPKAHEAERKKPIDPDKPKQRQTSAAPSSVAARSNTAAAPTAGSGASPSVSPATWKSELMAHLNRYKRYPSGASSAGTASVAFTIARSGQVLSAHLIGSSGNPALDAEAVSLPRRASPVPAPPSDFGGAVLTLTVPIHFGG
jgi:periplasmic protein TonB